MGERIGPSTWSGRPREDSQAGRTVASGSPAAKPEPRLYKGDCWPILLFDKPRAAAYTDG